MEMIISENDRASDLSGDSVRDETAHYVQTTFWI